jgi:hypothetical protein
MKDMSEIRVQITRFVEAYQPGLVECQLIDAWGKTWTFIEKIPVVTSENIWENTCYPQPGVIACRIVNEQIDAAGRRILTVDTEDPWGIESVTGEKRFDVLLEQVIDKPA